MKQFINKVFVLLHSNLVGEDDFGNNYYESRKVNRSFNRKSRTVIYRGIVEASKVPSKWSNWLNFQTDDVANFKGKRYKWQKDHVPNLTGTKNAYYPHGHVISKGQRDACTGDYERWIP